MLLENAALTAAVFLFSDIYLGINKNALHLRRLPASTRCVTSVPTAEGRWTYFNFIRGALILRAEIIPSEPDAGNADVGKRQEKNPFSVH